MTWRRWLRAVAHCALGSGFVWLFVNMRLGEHGSGYRITMLGAFFFFLTALLLVRFLDSVTGVRRRDS